jgi:hypothetical protein
MRPGTFAFRLNVPVLLEDGNKVNIPVDAVIMPYQSQVGFSKMEPGELANVPADPIFTLLGSNAAFIMP